MEPEAKLSLTLHCAGNFVCLRILKGECKTKVANLTYSKKTRGMQIHQLLRVPEVTNAIQEWKSSHQLMVTTQSLSSSPNLDPEGTFVRRPVREYNGRLYMAPGLKQDQICGLVLISSFS